MIKPSLARGLRLVGATTPDEYRKTIGKDAALERRFQPVSIDEPTVGATISILRGLKPRYEVHHGVEISDGALVTGASILSYLLVPNSHLVSQPLYTGLAMSRTGSSLTRPLTWSTKPRLR
jgi:ATP-dependent Clp protease ATP-binding subunit ClpA